MADECTWNPSKHNGQPCPKHGSGGKSGGYSTSIKGGQWKLKRDNADEEDISEEEYNELKGSERFDDDNDEELENKPTKEQEAKYNDIKERLSGVSDELEAKSFLEEIEGNYDKDNLTWEQYEDLKKNVSELQKRKDLVPSEFDEADDVIKEAKALYSGYDNLSEEGQEALQEIADLSYGPDDFDYFDSSIGRLFGLAASGEIGFDEYEDILRKANENKDLNKKENWRKALKEAGIEL